MMWCFIRCNQETGVHATCIKHETTAHNVRPPPIPIDPVVVPDESIVPFFTCAAPVTSARTARLVVVVSTPAAVNVAPSTSAPLDGHAFIVG